MSPISKQLEHHEIANVNQRFPILIFAHNLNHPSNVGSLFRMAEAFGVAKIYLSGSTLIPPNRKISKLSRSTEKYVDFEPISDIEQVINQKKKEGYQIVSLEITNDSISLTDFCQQKPQKVALIIGSEKNGVCGDLLQISDSVVHIPMYGKNSSINVAMATGIAVYQITQAMINKA